MLKFCKISFCYDTGMKFHTLLFLVKQILIYTDLSLESWFSIISSTLFHNRDYYSCAIADCHTERIWHINLKEKALKLVEIGGLTAGDSLRA